MEEIEKKKLFELNRDIWAEKVEVAVAECPDYSDRKIWKDELDEIMDNNRDILLLWYELRKCTALYAMISEEDGSKYVSLAIKARDPKQRGALIQHGNDGYELLQFFYLPSNKEEHKFNEGHKVAVLPTLEEAKDAGEFLFGNAPLEDMTMRFPISADSFVEYVFPFKTFEIYGPEKKKEKFHDNQLYEWNTSFTTEWQDLIKELNQEAVNNGLFADDESYLEGKGEIKTGRYKDFLERLLWDETRNDSVGNTEESQKKLPEEYKRNILSDRSGYGYIYDILDYGMTGYDVKDRDNFESFIGEMGFTMGDFEKSSRLRRGMRKVFYFRDCLDSLRNTEYDFLMTGLEEEENKFGDYIRNIIAQVRGISADKVTDDDLTAVMMEHKEILDLYWTSRKKFKLAQKLNQEAVKNGLFADGASYPEGKGAIKTSQYQDLLETFLCEETRDDSAGKTQQPQKRLKEEYKCNILSDESGDGYIYEILYYGMTGYNVKGRDNFEVIIGEMGFTMDDFENSSRLRRGMRKVFYFQDCLDRLSEPKYTFLKTGLEKEEKEFGDYVRRKIAQKRGIPADKVTDDDLTAVMMDHKEELDFYWRTCKLSRGLNRWAVRSGLFADDAPYLEEKGEIDTLRYQDFLEKFLLEESKICSVDKKKNLRKNLTEEYKRNILSDESGDGYIYDILDYGMTWYDVKDTDNFEFFIGEMGFTMDDFEKSSRLRRGMRKVFYFQDCMDRLSEPKYTFLKKGLEKEEKEFGDYVRRKIAQKRGIPADKVTDDDLTAVMMEHKEILDLYWSSRKNVQLVVMDDQVLVEDMVRQDSVEEESNKEFCLAIVPIEKGDKDDKNEKDEKDEKDHIGALMCYIDAAEGGYELRQFIQDSGGKVLMNNLVAKFARADLAKKSASRIFDFSKDLKDMLHIPVSATSYARTEYPFRKYEIINPEGENGGLSDEQENFIAKMNQYFVDRKSHRENEINSKLQEFVDKKNAEGKNVVTEREVRNHFKTLKPAASAQEMENIFDSLVIKYDKYIEYIEEEHNDILEALRNLNPDSNQEDLEKIFGILETNDEKVAREDQETFGSWEIGIEESAEEKQRREVHDFLKDLGCDLSPKDEDEFFDFLKGYDQYEQEPLKLQFNEFLDPLSLLSRKSKEAPKLTEEEENKLINIAQEMDKTDEEIKLYKDALKEADTLEYKNALEEKINNLNNKRKTDLENRKEALTKLLVSYLGFVIENASKVKKQFKISNSESIQFGDLFMAGYYGFVKAVLNYDPKTGAFGTYSYKYIEGETKNEIISMRASIHGYSKNREEEINKVERVSNQLRAKWGREPTAEEIAEELGPEWSVKKVEERKADHLAASKIEVSMEAPYTGEDEGEDANIGKFVDSNYENEYNHMGNPIYASDIKEMSDTITGKLSEQEKDVLAQRPYVNDFLESKVDENKRDEYIEKVRQIEQKGVRKLRSDPAVKEMDMHKYHQNQIDVNLSERLKEVSSMITPGNVVADMGFDHAEIPIALCNAWIGSKGKKGIPRAIVIEINKKDLENTNRRIEWNDQSKRIETRLSGFFDGLEGLKAEDDVDSLLFSGMEGKDIIKILEPLKEQGSKIFDGVSELVLQPQSDFAELRSCIRELDFLIDDEKLIREDGEFCFIIKAVKVKDLPSSKEKFVQDMEDLCGPVLMKNKDSELGEWMEKELLATKKSLKKLEDSMKKPEKEENLKSRLDEMEYKKELLVAAIEEFKK